MPAAGPVGVLDVGGSHAHAALARPDHAPDGLGWRLSDARRGPVDAAAGRDELLDQLTAPAATLGAADWVVALPGPFDYDQGRGDFADVAKLGALAGVDLRAELSPRLGVAPDRVLFVNDAVAYGLGEWEARPERPERFVCLTLGTGVGSAFLVDGAPVTEGRGVPPHGWAHLLRVDGRPLEDTVSTRAIRADDARRTGRDRDVRQIAEAARSGEDAARQAIERALDALGRALAPCLAGFGASSLVVGGGIARSWDLLKQPLREGLRAAGGRVPALAPSVLHDDAPLVGAAAWFSRRRSVGSPAPTP